MFRWGETAWLFGLVAAPVLAGFLLWSSVRAGKALGRLGDARLVAKLAASVNRRTRLVGSWFVVGATALMILALARPQFGTRVEVVSRVGQDIVVAVDISRSMLAEDVSPNRLARARLSVLRLMTRLRGDRIALVAFAGTAYLQSPLTTDYAAAATFLSAMNPEMMPVQGTDLGAALRVSLDALDRGAREARTVLIVTDGEDHQESFAGELDRALQEGVTVHALGIGSPEGIPIPAFDEQGRREGFLRDEEGAVVTSRLDEATMRDLTQRTGGRFARVGPGSAEFDGLIDEIMGEEGSAVDTREIRDFEERYQWFLAMALVLIAAEWLLPTGKRSQQARTAEEN